jgi:hypothetical protein
VPDRYPAIEDHAVIGDSYAMLCQDWDSAYRITRTPGAARPYARQPSTRSYGLAPGPMCYRAGGAGAASWVWRSVNRLISMITKTFLIYRV